MPVSSSQPSVPLRSYPPTKFTKPSKPTGIQEALRLYPPVPVGIPRVIPPPGRTVLGKWVAPGTRLSVHHYATSRSLSNFANPDTFAPERWLGDPAYEADRLEAVQPFAYGPRNCLGKSLAMHEMRLILACIFFRFDMQLCEDSWSWLDQRAFVLWEKKPLMCRVKLAA
jgi:cytochrome P450